MGVLEIVLVCVSAALFIGVVVTLSALHSECEKREILEKSFKTRMQDKEDILKNRCSQLSDLKTKTEDMQSALNAQGIKIQCHNQERINWDACMTLLRNQIKALRSETFEVEAEVCASPAIVSNCIVSFSAANVTDAEAMLTARGFEKGKARCKDKTSTLTKDTVYGTDIVSYKLHTLKKVATKKRK